MKITWLVVVALGLGAASAAPPRPVPPADLPAPRDPGVAELLDDRADWPRTSLGVGRLHTTTATPGLGTGWTESLVLPLFAAPGGEAAGWLAHGWRLADGTEPSPLATDCFVETEYETASLVVFRQEGDWLAVDLAAPCDGADGLWVHRAHLPPTVAYETWSARFGPGGRSPLFFRDAERHVLRAAPDPGAERLTSIAGDDTDTFEPLEVRGDWMRVRLSQPSDYCREPGAGSGSIEGWLRWRDEQRGPWVWSFARGC